MLTEKKTGQRFWGALFVPSFLLSLLVTITNNRLSEEDFVQYFNFGRHHFIMIDTLTTFILSELLIIPSISSHTKVLLVWKVFFSRHIFFLERARAGATGASGSGALPLIKVLLSAQN